MTEQELEEFIAKVSLRPEAALRRLNSLLSGKPNAPCPHHTNNEDCACTVEY